MTKPYFQPEQAAASSDQAQPAAPLVGHEARGRSVFGDEPLLSTLDRLLVVAQHLLPHRPEVSITLVQAGQAETLASSGELAWRLDQQQYSDRAGPCLSAATTGRPVSLLTASPPQTYRAFADAAAAAGVDEVLSLSLAAVTGTASLNIYNTSSHRFDQQSRTAAANIVGYLSAFLVNLASQQPSRQQGDQSARTRRPRRTAGRAGSVLLAASQHSPQAAFDHLVDLSQRHVRLAEPAPELVGHAVLGR